MSFAALLEPSDNVERHSREVLEESKFLQFVEEQLGARSRRPIEDKDDLFYSSRDNVFQLPKFEELKYKPSEFFAAVQEWEGVVTEIGESYFCADLIDLSAGAEEVTEKAEISFSDIDPADVDRVREGALFRWLIGHSRTRSGSFSRKWVIYFRRAAQRGPDTELEAVKLPNRFRIDIQIDA